MARALAMSSALTVTPTLVTLICCAGRPSLRSSGHEHPLQRGVQRAFFDLENVIRSCKIFHVDSTTWPEYGPVTWAPSVNVPPLRGCSIWWTLLLFIGSMVRRVTAQKSPATKPKLRQNRHSVLVRARLTRPGSLRTRISPTTQERHKSPKRSCWNAQLPFRCFVRFAKQ
jgi:hypothetical protein